MITRQTILEQPELNCAGVLGIKLAFILTEDGVELDRKWHRTSIPCDVSPEAQMAAVNSHLSVMEPPMPPVSQIDIDFIVQCHALLVQRYGA